ncbi:acyl-CoA thioesterase [Mycolicibacterium sp. BK556]|uniref:acyl-CoA thioesterase n=1 Tax=Mycobacteriaceae TaxID=1762 RepID=UPI00105D7136|nr:acyl-CoA thioesterase domain-containing protein [Mycobacterium sp. BK086]MBB3606227.1 acyl-CoA thioesterase [Mycolicibacterium sp. BK556]MBB3632806.1 acyl-CoA thioesterase [Mycolicibacterium sp. BK607]MBB3754153.1 acyl-CoA thioesterase [Mycolicibacterium sp. BK634]TDO17873.1 acyl-CoA thioesterase II [Mycobacterium sp. BK086]
MASLDDELNAAFTLTDVGDGVLRAPYFTERRGVVFGGQMVGQAVVAATRSIPDKRVRSVQTVFARGAQLDQPVDIRVEPMHVGRNIGSATVTFVQNDRLCARSLVLLDVEEPDLVRHQIPMPDVPSPDPAKAVAHWLAAPHTIVVGDVDIADPALTGPPTLQLWIRFPEAPIGDATVARALLAHASDGWLIATAMRPHAGLGQSMAHTEVSTGVLTQDVTFHDEFDARQWLLIDHEAQATGAGRTYGCGHVFTEDGRLVASFVQEALLRRFPDGQDPRGKTSTIF